MDITRDRMPFLPILLFQNKQIVLTIIMLLVLADIFLIKDSSDLRIFAILGIYLASIFFYKLKSKFTFLLSLVVFASMYIEFIASGTSEATEKAAVWLFFFLVVGIIQQLRE